MVHPVTASSVRFTIEETNNGSEPCIDELGIWSKDKKSVNLAIQKDLKVTLASSGNYKVIPNISWFISMMGDLEMITAGSPALKTRLGDPYLFETATNRPYHLAIRKANTPTALLPPTTSKLKMIKVNGSK